MARGIYTLTEKNNTCAETKQHKKRKHRDKSDLGPDFVAPDGGWGWVVCVAAGFGNFCLYPGMLQYGFIYRARMLSLGFDAKQVATIVNFLIAATYIVGIVNGAMFRRFTFRQVAIIGALLSFSGIFTSAFCTTFMQYLICLFIYGAGLGLFLEAGSLAVNTYFKLHRRRATGFVWTITGMGIVIFPHLSTFFLANFGGVGTILLYSAITLNSLACAFTLQPVLWHVKKTEKTCGIANPIGIVEEEYECKYCQHQMKRPGAEIIKHAPPSLGRTSDNGFRPNGIVVSNEFLEKALNDKVDEKQGFYKPNQLIRKRADSERIASETKGFSSLDASELLHCTCAKEKVLAQEISEKELALKQKILQEAAELEELERKNMKIGQKIIKFFDLDLLKDITFVNLVVGMAVMMIGEINFSVLTPFILESYGFKNEEMSVVISVLGGMDIAVRFLAPFALEKVKLGNHVFFAFGMICISVGRFIVTITSSFYVMIVVFVLIGFGRGFRMLFAKLVLPGYVPLNRLPAASGLQLVCNAITTLTLGPLLGVITDATSYTVTIHFINLLTFVAVLFWIIESIIRKIFGVKPVEMEPY